MQNPGPNYNYNSGNQTSPYMPGLAAAGITAGAQIGSTIASGIGAGKRQRKQHQHQMNMAGQQFRHNKKLANLAFQNNMKAIAAQNAYNTPAQQMARYKAAGLNPNLVVGQGGPGNQTQAAQYSQQPTNYQAIEAPHSPVSGYEVFGQALQSGLSGIQQYQSIEQSRQQIEMSQMDLILRALTIDSEAGATIAKNLFEQMRYEGGRKSQAWRANEAEIMRLTTLGVLQRANTTLAGTQAALNEQNVKQSKQSIMESKARVQKIEKEMLLLAETTNNRKLEGWLLDWRKDQSKGPTGYDPAFESQYARLFKYFILQVGENGKQNIKDAQEGAKFLADAYNKVAQNSGITQNVKHFYNFLKVVDQYKDYIDAQWELFKKQGFMSPGIDANQFWK